MLTFRGKRLLSARLISGQWPRKQKPVSQRVAYNAIHQAESVPTRSAPQLGRTGRDLISPVHLLGRIKIVYPVRNFFASHFPNFRPNSSFVGYFYSFR